VPTVKTSATAAQTLSAAPPITTPAGSRGRRVAIQQKQSTAENSDPHDDLDSAEEDSDTRNAIDASLISHLLHIPRGSETPSIDERFEKLQQTFEKKAEEQYSQFKQLLEDLMKTRDANNCPQGGPTSTNVIDTPSVDAPGDHHGRLGGEIELIRAQCPKFSGDGSERFEPYWSKVQ
jgi:hypothetical protein